MHAACVLACDEQPAQRGGAVGGELHPAHHVVSRRHHFHQPRGEIEAAVGAALHHALEVLAHPLRAEVRHGDVQAAMRTRISSNNF